MVSELEAVFLSALCDGTGPGAATAIRTRSGWRRSLGVTLPRCLAAPECGASALTHLDQKHVINGARQKTPPPRFWVDVDLRFLSQSLYLEPHGAGAMSDRC